MIEEIKKYLKKYNLLDEQKTFLVGFSGGYDSMCLLDCLNNIREDFKFNLIAIHLNHNWRGESALKEQENCKKYCEKNNIEFYTETLSDDVKKTETIAREKRQDFFKYCYKKYNADGIFLAHTKSDNTETIIYRMTKGTGLNGLCGILEFSKLDFCKIYRPLMNFSRNEILEYCKNNNLTPNDDSSNHDTKYARNFIRHKVVTELKTINPNIDDTFQNLSKIAISEQNIINEYLLLIKKDILQNNTYKTKKFIKLSNDVQNRLILDFLIQNNIDYDTKKINDINQFINQNKNSNSGKLLSLTSSLWLYVSKDKIYMVNNLDKKSDTDEIAINACGKFKFKNFIFEIAEYKNTTIDKYPKENENFAFIQLECLNNLTIRTRRDGDKIQPFGMNGSMKLKKLLINKGVEKFLRDEIILLCNDKEVLWVSGVCLSEKLRVKDNPTHIIKIIQNKDLT